MLPNRPVYNEEHEMFRDAVRGFIKAELLPHFARWEEEGIVDRWMWDKAGEAGLLCPGQIGILGRHGGITFAKSVLLQEA